MKRNKNKTILSIAVCASVAAPIICMPFGIRDGVDPSIVVRLAYAATMPEDENPVIEDENTITEEDILEGIDDELSMTVLNGGLVESTYYEGYEPSNEPTDTQYSDVSTYTVYQPLDEAGLPIELLDPMFFAPDNTTYYIAAQSSILKESPDMSSMTVQPLAYGKGVTRIGIGDTWSKIQTEDGAEGYVLTNTLSYEMVWTAVDRIVWVDTSSLSLRKSASVEAELIGTLYDEDKLRVVAVADKWFKVITEDGTEGYVYGSYTTTQAPPTPTPTPIPVVQAPGGGGGSGGGGGGGTKKDYNNVSKPLITGRNRESIVNAAVSMLGKPYVWGASSSSAVDCSGLVVYCYGLVGISLPHYSVSLCSVGQPVSRENILPGDIVCWTKDGSYCHHVGIYVGNGQCIDARGKKWGVVYGSLDMHPILTIRRVIA